MSETLGFLFGKIVEKVSAYFFSIPFGIITSYLVKNVFEALNLNSGISSKLSDYLSLNRPFSDGMRIEYRGAVIDILFISKILLSLSFALFFAILLWFVVTRTIKIKQIIAMILSVSICVVLSVLYLNVYPKEYTETDKLYVLNTNTPKYQIVGYSGEITLSEFAEYDVNLDINRTSESAESLELRLDSAMDIKNISTDKYIRNGDILIITDKELLSGKKFVLRLSCKGRLAYYNNLRSINIYTSNTSCAIPARFAFLPKIDSDDCIKKYELKVNCKNDFITNLDFKKTSDNEYAVTGDSKQICMYSGYFTSFEKDGVIIYRAKYNFKTDYIQKYNQLVNNKLKYRFDTNENSLIQFTYEPKNKLFIIYDRYGTGGFPTVYDDFITLTYGMEC